VSEASARKGKSPARCPATASRKAESGRRTLRLQRTVEARPTGVWRYWTDADLIRRWWSPVHFAVVECEAKPAPGGLLRIVMTEGDSTRHTAVGRYVALDKPRALSFELAPFGPDGKPLLFSVHRVRLARFGEAIEIGDEALPLVEELRMEDQRARLHIVVGCARCGLGDPGGLDQIETGIEVAEAAGTVDMLTTGYTNLSSELHFFGRLVEARDAYRQFAGVAERYGLGRYLRTVRADAAYWAYLDGRWDEAVALADEAVARVDTDDHHFTDAIVVALRGWIRFARGDAVGAGRDTERAAELARAADLRAQAAAYPIRAAVALANGDRDEAETRAAELAAIGPAMVAGLCAAFPSLTDVAWVFRDLGRENEFSEVVLDADPIKSAWNDASRAIVNSDLVRAADIIDEIGHTAGAAYARLRAAGALAAAGKEAEAAAQHAQAGSFYRQVDATRFLRECERLDGAPTRSRKASAQG
jgi:uncharacterized protein YndB with AHSA1/START domain